MNRSYSKKRHIDQANALLESRFIGEKTIINEGAWDLLYLTPLAPLKLAYDVNQYAQKSAKQAAAAGERAIAKEVEKRIEQYKQDLAKAGAKTESIEKWGNYFCVPVKAAQLGISPTEWSTGSITYVIDGNRYFDNGRAAIDGKMGDYHCQDANIVHSKGTTKVTGGGGTGGGSKKSSWDTTCDGESKPFKKMCKGETIKKVQGCLGITADGLFGSGTATAVNNKIGKNFFTNADIDKLCGVTSTNTGEVINKVGGSDNTDNNDNQDLSATVDFS